MRYSLSIVLLLAVALTLSALNFFSINQAGPIKTQLIDVSWPNCRPAYQLDYQTGIVGVTGGLDFKPNPCLTQQTSWFMRYWLYMNTGYPGDKAARRFSKTPLDCASGASRCLGYNYGYNAARYALNYAARADAHTNMWWLDVETDNSWSTDTSLNRDVLRGAEAAIERYSLLAKVGYYSAPMQWQQITGNWHNGRPVWLGTGSLKSADAIKACRGQSFTGGHTWLTQYTNILDINIKCLPAASP